MIARSSESLSGALHRVRLRGLTIAVLRRLIPRPIAFTLALATLDTVEGVVDRRLRDERDDFIDDFVEL